MTAPEVLLLDDDGELDRIHAALRKLGIDVLRLRGDEIEAEVPAPRAMLVVSGPRSVSPPRFVSDDAAPSEPVRMCLHTQDFQPLRERLALGGIHLLVQNSIDDESLNLLLLSLLHGRDERRGSLRTRITAPLRVVIEGQSTSTAELADVGLDACKIHYAARPAEGCRARISLPAELTGNQPIVVPGCVVRSAQRDDEERPYAVVIRYDDDLALQARDIIRALVEGRRLGVSVATLAPLPSRPATSEPRLTGYVDGSDVPDWVDMASDADRRRDERRGYLQRVETFTAFAESAPHCALGKDLSVTGVSIVGHPALGVDTPVTLCLHSGGRSEPVVVDAVVVRDADDIGLEFRSLTPALVQQLERLVAAGSFLEAVSGDAGDPLIVSEFLDVGSPEGKPELD